MTMWMVRAEGNRLFQPFLDRHVVAIGWSELGDLHRYSDKAALQAAVRDRWPDWKPQAQAMAVGMVHRFVHEIAVGDWVISYNKQARVYAAGKVTGAYRHDPSFEAESPNVRDVEWVATDISQDALAARTKNTLGSVMTLFQVSPEAETEITGLALGDAPVRNVVAAPPQPDDEENVLSDIEARSIEFIKDKIVRHDWDDMQELTAGLLRAMGYKTRISRAGPDRGKDIVASPDGFGFEDPRIVVEVKHRPKNAMGSKEIRGFLGGRHPGEKGLYVSTGGFSKDAQYEAERANIPVTLLDLDGLAETIIENYEAMDTETQRLIPMKRIYWPLG